ncbi:hypothetical protein [Parasitella parasitica]|uniref:Uncharacterized protein n=1 Tax=Parasitella parasitica TaxID=35722 RepID=A0A0B7NED9_9FUNG|nr:hypothetical protein [Parasitella parasitica]
MPYPHRTFLKLWFFATKTLHIQSSALGTADPPPPPLDTSTLLRPSNTPTGPSVDQILDWDAKQDDTISSSPVKFFEAIPGTITPEEFARRKSIEKDILVSLDSDALSGEDQAKQQLPSMASNAPSVHNFDAIECD